MPGLEKYLQMTTLGTDDDTCVEILFQSQGKELDLMYLTLALKRTCENQVNITPFQVPDGPFISPTTLIISTGFLFLEPMPKSGNCGFVYRTERFPENSYLFSSS